MDNKLIQVVIAITVGIVVLGSLLVPVITEASTTEKTFTNEGYFRATETSDETVIEWDPSTDPFTLVINGDNYSLDALKQFGNYSIAFSDDFILRYYYTSASSQNLQIWNSAYVVGAGSTATYKVTITINDSGITWSTGQGSPTSVTHSGSYFVMDSKGEFVMKYGNTDAYINPSSTIVYAGGISSISTTNVFTSIFFEGTADDITVTPMRNNMTVTDIASTTSEVSGYLDLSKLSKVTFTTTATVSEVEYNVDQTYTYFLVPYQVTAEMSQHLDTTEIGLLAVIPVLMIVAFLVFAVRIFGGNRD